MKSISRWETGEEMKGACRAPAHTSFFFDTIYNIPDPHVLLQEQRKTQILLYDQNIGRELRSTSKASSNTAQYFPQLIIRNMCFNQKSHIFSHPIII